MLLKLQAYKSFHSEIYVEVTDEHNCRFAKEFQRIIKPIEADRQTISMVVKHHSNVHQKIQEAITLWCEGNSKEAIETMTDAEKSSKAAFEKLHASFARHTGGLNRAS